VFALFSIFAIFSATDIGLAEDVWLVADVRRDTVLWATARCLTVCGATCFGAWTTMVGSPVAVPEGVAAFAGATNRIASAMLAAKSDEAFIAFSFPIPILPLGA